MLHQLGQCFIHLEHNQHQQEHNWHQITLREKRLDNDDCAASAPTASRSLSAFLSNRQ
jgi:hypothetical protein